MPPRKRIGLKDIMGVADGAPPPVAASEQQAQADDAASDDVHETEVSCVLPSNERSNLTAPADEPPAQKSSRGAAGRTKYQTNQLRRKEMKAEAVEECKARGVSGEEEVSLAWFKRLEAASLLTPMQKTLYNALRTQSGQTVTASAALANVQKDVDNTLRRDLEEARAKLAELTTKSAEVTGPSPASLERAEIRKELAELRKLLADERKKKKAESAPPPEVSCSQQTSAKQAPQPHPPRVYQMPSFSSSSAW